MLINMLEKRCPRCEITRPETDFHKRTASSDGLDTYCKICRNNDKQASTNLETTTDEYVKNGAEKVLTNLGYEIYNGNNPVYLQFNKRLKDKYGITFKE